MDKIKSVTEKSNMKHDIWFSGKGDVLQDGTVTYFICEHLNPAYYDEKEKDFHQRCMYLGKNFDGDPECGMDCEMYGKCDNCRGFSAVRCQECTIPRP